MGLPVAAFAAAAAALWLVRVVAIGVVGRRMSDASRGLLLAIGVFFWLCECCACALGMVRAMAKVKRAKMSYVASE